MTIGDLGERVHSGDDLLRSAHERVYHWPAEFSGFRARLEFATELGSGGGTVVFKPRATPEIEVEARPSDASWLGETLGSLAGHRWHAPYDERDGRYRKVAQADDGHPLGQLIELEDSLHSRYRIRGGEITEITREPPGGGRFTIVIQARGPAPGGTTVATAFSVFTWDTEVGSLIHSEAVSDGYLEQAGLILPSSRQLTRAEYSGVSARVVTLFDHEVLAPR